MKELTLEERVQWLENRVRVLEDEDKKRRRYMSKFSFQEISDLLKGKKK